MTATFKIGGRNVGLDHEPFVIAEAGINHNGDIETAFKMVDAAIEAGVDAVKFQTFKTEDFLTDTVLTYTYRSQGKEIVESMYDMFKRTEFSREEWIKLKQYCDDKGITFLSTPVTIESLEFLVELGISAVKVGSDDFNNTPLVSSFAEFDLPLLLSCGMADEDEIQSTLAAAEKVDVCLFLCTSQYPTPAEDVNARKLLEMGKKFPNVVLGFSDHTQGSIAAIIATAYGARVFEKHFTLGHDLPGPDHWFSSEPAELKQWSSSIRTAFTMLGDACLKPTSKEQEMRSLARRSVVAMMDIACGETLSEKNTGLRRPGTGIKPASWPLVIGKTSSRTIAAGEQLSWEDLAD